MHTIFNHIQSVLDELNKLPRGTVTAKLAEGMQNILSSAIELDDQVEKPKLAEHGTVSKATIG